LWHALVVRSAWCHTVPHGYSFADRLTDPPAFLFGTAGVRRRANCPVSLYLSRSHQSHFNDTSGSMERLPFGKRNTTSKVLTSDTVPPDIMPEGQALGAFAATITLLLL